LRAPKSLRQLSGYVSLTGTSDFPDRLGYSATMRGERFVDPFNTYGLDSDSVPSRIEPDEQFAKRDVPADAWHCFHLTRTDRQSLTPNHIASLTGPWARYAPRLPGRLEQVGLDQQSIGPGCRRLVGGGAIRTPSGYSETPMGMEDVSRGGDAQAGSAEIRLRYCRAHFQIADHFCRRA
jgi:hypothetical protein